MNFNLGKFLEDFTDFSSDELSLKMKILRSIGRFGLYLFTKSASYDELIETLLARQEKIAVCCDVPFLRQGQVSAINNDYHCLFVRSNQLDKLVNIFIQNNDADSDGKLVSFRNSTNRHHKKFLRQVQFKFEILNARQLNTLLPVVDHTNLLAVEVGAENFSIGSSFMRRLDQSLRTSEDAVPSHMKEEVSSFLKIFRASRVWETKVEQQTEKRVKILILGRGSGTFFQRFIARWKNKSDQLLREAVSQYPDAIFYYWQDHDSQKIANYYENYLERNQHDFVVLKTPQETLNLIGNVEHIYTETSPFGFLGTLLGAKVSTYAKIFYTGLGLTQDRYLKKLARKNVSIEEAFYAYFLNNRTYFHPLSGAAVSFPQMISFLVLEKISLTDIFTITDADCDFTTLSAFETQLSSALRLAIYLRNSAEISKADKAQITTFISGEVDVHDCMQAISLLVITANYDAVVTYCIRLLELIDIENASLDKQKFLYANILRSLSFSIKNSNGRVIPSLPNLVAKVDAFNPTFEEDQELILQLARCYSFNIQYRELESLMDVVLRMQNLPIDFLRKLCNVLDTRPGRSERDSKCRFRLLHRCALRLKEVLNKEFPGYANQLLTRIVYFSILRNVEEVASDYCKLTKFLPGSSLFGVLKKPSSVIFLIQRYKDVASLFAFLLKQREVDLAKDFIHQVSFIKTRKHSRLWLHYYSYVGDNSKFLSFYNEMGSKEKEAAVNLALYGRILRSAYQYDLAVDAYRTQIEVSDTREKKVAAKASLEIVDFLKSSSEILNSYPQPRQPKGVVFVASQNCYNSLAMLVPALLQLKKKGYVVINLTEGLVETPATGIPFLDRYANGLSANLFGLKNEYDWHIDWRNRKVECNGVNFYQGFYERLSTTHRKYFVDLNERLMSQDLVTQIRRSDACLSICEKIFQEVVLENNFPVTFISGNSHVTPFSIFRDFCRSKDHEKLGFVNANVAYENYFSNLNSKYANTMCVTDMTLHKTIRAPFLARKDQFENWYSRNKGVDLYRDKAKSLINVNRNNSQNNDADPELIEFLKQERSKGKKIVCAFGKIPVDLNVPFDGGSGHTDMADWINHTIKVVNSLDDVVLLLKPHPHELRPEIALDLVDRFEDLIDVEKELNIRMLGHREINVHALAPYLDLALLWNGSSSLELTVLGVPVMMCSYFGKYDYPVDLYYPESRDEYEKNLLEMEFEEPNSEIRERAAFLMCYMGTDEISIPNQYSLRAVTNDKVGVPRWNAELVEKFLKFEDPAMELAANRIVEKAEKHAI